jgi:pimeloyl-[acyl-carrier protein] methyl ester esterase
VSGLYFEAEGTGPTVVLLHGWALNLRVWDGLRAALSGRFRLVALDLPGHGRSDFDEGRASLEGQAGQIRETLAAIAERYALVGWSFGGQIALELAGGSMPAGDRPSTLARSNAPKAASRGAPPTPPALTRLALIATSPRLTVAPDWPDGAPPERLAAQAATLRADYRRTVSEFLELQVRGGAGSDDTLAQLRAALFAHGEARPAALARGLDLLRAGDLRALAPRVAVPALVIAGQYDRITPPSAGRALAAALPRGRYVEIRRAAHAPFLSHPGEVAALLDEFLADP